MDNKIDLQQLACYIALMKHQNVSKAANDLGLSQPTVSLSLKKLRETFNDPLLIRSNGRMTPTSRALALETEIQEILHKVDALNKSEASFDPFTSEATFSIMCPEFVEYYLAPRIAARLEKDAPHIKVEFKTSNPSQAFDMLDKGALDFRFGWWPKPNLMLRTKILFRDELVCISKKNKQLSHKLSISEFINARHVRLEAPRNGVSTMVIDQAVLKIGEKIDIGLEVQTIFNLVKTVSETDFLACIGNQIAQDIKNKFMIEIRPIPLNVPEIRIALYWHERTHRQASHIWLKNIIEAEMLEINNI
jgi:DNA-binding transcriptional LysR family regulator